MRFRGFSHMAVVAWQGGFLHLRSGLCFHSWFPGTGAFHDPPATDPALGGARTAVDECRGPPRLPPEDALL